MDIETRRSAECDLSHWQYIVLADVQHHPDTSQKRLADRIVRSPSRLAVDVDELHTRGLLGRDSADHDRRVHRLRLTPAGRTLASRVRRQIHRDEDRLLARLTEAQREQLRELLIAALDPDSL